RSASPEGWRQTRWPPPLSRLSACALHNPTLADNAGYDTGENPTGTEMWRSSLDPPKCYSNGGPGGPFSQPARVEAKIDDTLRFAPAEHGHDLRGVDPNGDDGAGPDIGAAP